MKILTLNCQKAYQLSFKYFIVRVLREETYNFLLLQEANDAVVSIISETHSSYKI